MAAFDYVVIGIVVISLALGLWRGVVGEVIAIIAWIAAVMGALEFGAATGQAVFAGIADPALRALAGCTLIFVGILVAMALVRLAVRQMVKALGLSLSDRDGLRVGARSTRRARAGCRRRHDLGTAAGVVAGGRAGAAAGDRGAGGQAAASRRVGEKDSIQLGRIGLCAEFSA